MKLANFTKQLNHRRARTNSCATPPTRTPKHAHSMRTIRGDVNVPGHQAIRPLLVFSHTLNQPLHKCARIEPRQHHHTYTTPLYHHAHCMSISGRTRAHDTKYNDECAPPRSPARHCAHIGALIRACVCVNSGNCVAPPKFILMVM